ncbi:MAG TPA: hypothetical protein VGN37_22375 [Actinocatenispora sp.]
MNTLFEKYRQRRTAHRRVRAINRALERCPSRAMRDELLTIANRDY